MWTSWSNIRNPSALHLQIFSEMAHRGYPIRRYWGNGEPREARAHMVRMDAQPPEPIPEAACVLGALLSTRVPDLTSPCTPEEWSSLRVRLSIGDAADTSSSPELPLEVHPVVETSRRRASPPPPPRRPACPPILDPAYSCRDVGWRAMIKSAGKGD